MDCEGATSTFQWHWPLAEAGGGCCAISVSVYQWKRGWHWTAWLSEEMGGKKDVENRGWGSVGKKKGNTWDTDGSICFCTRERRQDGERQWRVDMGEVRCGKPRGEDAQSVLSGFLAVRDNCLRLQALLQMMCRLTNDDRASMFLAVQTIGSFVSTAGIIFHRAPPDFHCTCLLV